MFTYMLFVTVSHTGLGTGPFFEHHLLSDFLIMFSVSPA